MKSFQQFIVEPSPAVQLFHKDIGIPTSLAKPLPGMRLRYGYHAAERAQEKGIDKLPTALPTSFIIIETEATNGVTSKWVVRFSYDQVNDIVMPILPDGFVKTAWLNAKVDTHKTLKRFLYTDPRNFRVH
jgi:hypothetical protein